MVGNTVRFAYLLNKYRLLRGSPKSILLPDASRVAGIQQITVTGTLLKNQLVQLYGGEYEPVWRRPPTVPLDQLMAKRRIAVAKGGGHYSVRDDGSLSICLGIRKLQSHVVCRFQRGLDWQWLFNQAVGERIMVSGFLRCSLAEAGFQRDHDAHIFEIHPVRAVSIRGELHSIEAGIPEPDRIQIWTSELSSRDAQVRVHYWKGSDILVFRRIEGDDVSYVQLAGRVVESTLIGSRNRVGRLRLSTPVSKRKIEAYCLPGTRATWQLRQLKSVNVSIVGLRTVDLSEALQNRFKINLIALDIQQE